MQSLATRSLGVGLALVTVSSGALADWQLDMTPGEKRLFRGG